MKILGIDYGEKKIGLSLSEGKLATPLGIEENTKNLERKIKDLCQKEEIKKIVIGTAEGYMAQRQREFGSRIAKACHLPVLFWDETLSSREAIQKMIELGKTRKKRRQEDAFSAALILQSYLDAQNL